MEPRDAEGKATARTARAVVVLVLEAVFAVVGVWFHYGMTAEYGDVTELAEDRSAGVSSVLEFGGLALILVVVAALAVVCTRARHWARLTAVAIPALMVVAMIGVTPAALREKLVSSYSDTPQCVFPEFMEQGPGLDAERESQAAFESIEHVGHFSGGGGSGVVGCDPEFVLIEEVDALQHYRAALPRAGWSVTEDDARHLRAERDGMAFEVVMCRYGGGVWAGNSDITGGARCRPVY